jgi:hypothetical protein
LIQYLHVEFLASKVDDYDCVNCFFKIIDIDGVSKLKPLLGLNEDNSFKMPIWLSDKRESLLKVKKKFVPDDGNGYCVKGGLYTINIEFILYNMTVDEDTIKGYYAKIQNIKKIESLDNIEIKMDINNEN